jgi:hypothetical protein
MSREFTNKEIEFLSDEELFDVLLSVLNEIDAVARVGAHRATTYLAMSATEGIFGQILKLKKRVPTATYVPKKWPKWKKAPKPLERMGLLERYRVLQSERLLPRGFAKVFESMIDFRNYMHPDAETADLTPIELSVAQRALSYLNAIIELYQPLRFLAGAEWELIIGKANVPEESKLRLPLPGYDPLSILVSKYPAKRFRSISFRVTIPRDGIFDFVYNFGSYRQFMAARIEGRVDQNGKGYDNGRLICENTRLWNIDAGYIDEPNPNQSSHIVEINLRSAKTFQLIVDNKEILLEGGNAWNYDPEKRIGFMAEVNPISIADLLIKQKR